MKDKESESISIENDRVKFQYQKSPQHKTIHVSGIFGGIMPDKKIQVHFWHNEVPIPKNIFHKIVKESGEGYVNLGEEVEEERQFEETPPPFLIRNIDISATIDPAVARSIGNWLINRADMIEKKSEREAEHGQADDSSGQD